MYTQLGYVHSIRPDDCQSWKIIMYHVDLIFKIGQYFHNDRSAGDIATEVW